MLRIQPLNDIKAQRSEKLQNDPLPPPKKKKKKKIKDGRVALVIMSISM